MQSVSVIPQMVCPALEGACRLDHQGRVGCTPSDLLGWVWEEKERKSGGRRAKREKQG